MSIVMKMENKYQVAKSNIVNTLVRQIGYEAYKNLYSEDFDTLQELVDKTTPKKPIISYPMGDCYYTCSCCGNLLIEKRIVISSSGKKLIKDFAYCSKCGREMDWSGFDEE